MPPARGGDALTPFTKRPGEDIRAPFELVAGGAAATVDEISLKTLVLTTA
jgi:hypothetical protein